MRKLLLFIVIVFCFSACTSLPESSTESENRELIASLEQLEKSDRELTKELDELIVSLNELSASIQGGDGR